MHGLHHVDQHKLITSSDRVLKRPVGELKRFDAR